MPTERPAIHATQGDSFERAFLTLPGSLSNPGIDSMPGGPSGWDATSKLGSFASGWRACATSRALAEIPIASFLISPEGTRSVVEKAYIWVDSHQRLFITVVAAVAGVYLLIVGISKL